MLNINDLVKIMFEDIHIHYAGGGGDVVSDDSSTSSDTSSQGTQSQGTQSQGTQSQGTQSQGTQSQGTTQKVQPVKKPSTTFEKNKKTSNKEEKKSVFVRNHIRMLGRRPSPTAMHQRFGSFT
jgi:hypothetical protein